MEDTFITYKKAIKAKYEQEKNGENWHFLLDPTPKKIRDLTLFVFEETHNENDLKTFQNFIGFAFETTKIQKIKEEIDKFRPLVTFLKGKTELADSTSADMLAVILDFNPRPYRNFIKKNTSATNIIEKVNSEVKKESLDNFNSEEEKKEEKKKKRGIPFVFIVGILTLGISVFYNVKTTTEKNCMIWNIDHYETFDCNNKQQGFIYNMSPIPSDEKLLNNFRKIEVDSNTPFFDAKKQPIVWYGKNANKEYEYFTHYGNGKHPETGKTLKPISNYIINKYIKNK